jgi:hypothetical protein
MVRTLGEGFEELGGAVAPDWRSLVTWVWLRLRYNLDEQSVGAGLTMLGIGVATLALARWPFVFSSPWFVLTAVAGFALLRRGRLMQGFLFLLAVVLVPLLFAWLGPRKLVSASTVEQLDPDPQPVVSFIPAPPPPTPSAKAAPVDVVAEVKELDRNR